jgi:hypothetical protein
MNCNIFFHDTEDVVMKIVEYLYNNGFTLETSKIKHYMHGSISFQIPDSQKNKELMRILMNQINEDLNAQLILGKIFAGTKDIILNDNLKVEIKRRVNAGILPLNPQIRKL